MEEGKGLTSAAAFVEGGIQEACDDACSICLEHFSDTDPSTVTSCKHEFHLQCILEWCQRSSQCPMCWQAISFKDPNSQQLLDAVEHERNVRMNPPIFHHPTLGDFELQHLPVSASESELEERIIQHLAAAAAMGRARQFARREGHRNRNRNRSSTQDRPHFLVFSTQTQTHPNGGSAPPTVMIAAQNSPFIADDSSSQDDQPMTTAASNQHGSSSSNRSPVRTSPSDQDMAGPSDFQAFSETLKSRLSALSTRYKESFTKSTRSWKDKIFSRNSSMPRARESESDQGIPAASRMIDNVEQGRTNEATVSNTCQSASASDPNTRQNIARDC